MAVDQTTSTMPGRAAAAARRVVRTPISAGALVVLLGLLATAVVASAVAGDTRRDVGAQLERTATDIDMQVSRQLEAAESALLTMAAQVRTGTASQQRAAVGPVQHARGRGGPRAAGDRVRPGHRDRAGPHVAPRAIHPLAPNVGVLGRNILRDPERTSGDRGGPRQRPDGRHVDRVSTPMATSEAILVVVPIHIGSPATISERRAAFTGVMMAVVSPSRAVRRRRSLPWSPRSRISVRPTSHRGRSRP